MQASKLAGALWLAVALGWWSSAVGAGEIPPADRTVVLLSVDGLAAFYRDDPRAEMPNLRALAKAGAEAAMKASAPTVTWPNHTTLVTGVTPARHGVIGNNYFDRASGKAVALISDPVFDKDQIVKTPTIYDLAKAAGLRTAGVRWPASRNAAGLDWSVPDVATDELLHQYTTADLLAECRAAEIWADGEASENSQRDVRIVSDEMCLRVFMHILQKHRPNLALLHIINVDHVQHLSGPRSPEAYAAIAAADKQVGQVWEELKRAYPERATLFVVSDHGFSPVEHLLFPNVVLRDAGLVEVDGKRVTGGAVRLVVQGGSAMVYLLAAAKEAGANREAVEQRVKQLLGGIDGVAQIVEASGFKEHGIALPQEDPRAPDLIVFAREGYGFSDAAGGTATVLDNPERKGNHGHDENLPHLQATFAAWGYGIRPGARLELISNTDVAPTAARLLDLSLPATDGRVLTEFLGD